MHPSRRAEVLVLGLHPSQRLPPGSTSTAAASIHLCDCGLMIRWHFVGCGRILRTFMEAHLRALRCSKTQLGIRAPKHLRTFLYDPGGISEAALLLLLRGRYRSPWSSRSARGGDKSEFPLRLLTWHHPGFIHIVARCPYARRSKKCNPQPLIALKTTFSASAAWNRSPSPR